MTFFRNVPFRQYSRNINLIILVILFLTLFTGEVSAQNKFGVHNQAAKSWGTITIDSVNLSAVDFHNAATSTDNKAKNRALFYLLGVLDTTEGTVWCGYDSINTSTPKDQIIEYFNSLSKKELERERASDVIEKALRKNYPSCKNGRSPTQPQLRQELTTESYNLSAEDFFKAYLTRSEKGLGMAIERENAMMYLLGVMDTTEGKTWCNYWHFKTISLRESLYSYFKRNISEERLKERASAVITESLNSNPCRRDK